VVNFANSLFERAESYEGVIKAIPHRADDFVKNWLRDGFALLEVLREAETDEKDVALFILSDAVDYLNHQLDYLNEDVWAFKIAIEEIE